MLPMSTRSSSNRRHKHQHISPFANDPTRLPPITFSNTLSAPLPNHELLSTALIDVLLHYSFRFPETGFAATMPTDLLVGSSNTMEILKCFTDPQKYPPSSKEIMEPLQRNHSAYGSSPYRLLVPTCIAAHFFTVDVEFDINSDQVFRYVRVYDSLAPVFSITGNDAQAANPMKVSKSSTPARFLRCLQAFLIRYCFVDKQSSKQYKMLQSNPDYIIDLANYENCPQQKNTWDCGLFSLAVVLHLANKVPITKNVFTQEDISKLRSALHKEFSNNMAGSASGTRTGRSLRFLTPQFLYSFFPKLPSAPTRVFGAASSTEPPHPAPYDGEKQKHKDESSSEPHPAPYDREKQKHKDESSSEPPHLAPHGEKQKQDESSSEPQPEEEQPEAEPAAPSEPRAPTHGMPPEKNEEQQPQQPEAIEMKEEGHSTTAEAATKPGEEDHLFLQRFLPSTEGDSGEEGGKKKPPLYSDYDDIFTLIDEYEIVSGFRLAIRRSKNGGRLYCCASHEQCNFKAQFGRVRGSPHLISLKPNNSCFVHNGPPVPESSRDGRSKKRRLARNGCRAIKKVATVNNALAVSPWDVVKSSVNTEQLDITYMQCHSVLSKRKESSHAVAKASYQKLVPYLKEFLRLNPGSAAISELDDDNHLDRVFVCPSIMQRSLTHVRPVMSLDAAPLKATGGGGILYMASVKSACNHLYPVALAITSENENKEGWIWFLENLQVSLPVLELPHPKEGVSYNLFTFISDRQQGLVDALKEVFPRNHCCYCAVHIARNVEATFGGPQQSKYVIPLAQTFSLSEADKMLEAMSARARAYVEAIEQPQWRSTAWMQDEALPPRYGIVTSNMSESLNSMFERARDVHWKSSINMILSKMVERIAQLSEEYEHKTGVVDEVVGRLQYCWEHCAGLEVYSMKDPERSLYTVFSQSGEGVDEEVQVFNFDATTKSCDCGLWQEHGYPCIHAVAYYKKYLKYNFDQLMNEVDCKYTYENESRLFEKNFLIVCDAKIVGDKKVLPPVFKKKKKKARRTKMMTGTGTCPPAIPGTIRENSIDSSTC